ncbi:MAG: efflux RND transporter permease subunit, partial [Phycisphaerales bacterium]|nr:efflux RND transporter permease subunit [Phycisphaerales bacterium]
KPACSITVFKVGDDDAVELAEIVKAYAAGRRGEAIERSASERFAHHMAESRARSQTGLEDVDVEPVSDRIRAWELGHKRFQEGELPGKLAVTTDLARFIVGRLDLLTRNAAWGGALVFIVLVLLLNWRVSFWVALGLVISILGTLAAMHFAGVTLNLLTMFGLIVVLGLLVDDAIVVAENIMSRHEQGEPPLVAAINGCNEVGWPVVATVVTTICAFLPLALIEGQLGDMMGVLPQVVAVALLVSLMEALIILPSHLGHSLVRIDAKRSGEPGILQRVEFRFDAARDGFMNHILVPTYSRLLRVALRERYIAVAIAFALVIMSIGLVVGGRIEFTMLESDDAETINVELRMPVGTPIDRTDAIVKRIEAACLEQPEVDFTWAISGAYGSLDGLGNSEQSHIGQVILELKPVEQRDRPSPEIIRSIRAGIGEIPDMRRLRIEGITGGPDGSDVTLTVVGDDPALIMPAIEDLKAALASEEAVYDIADDADAGQPELRIELLDGARELGFTTESVARQIRAMVFGIEAHTFPGDREDVDVRVTFPQETRRSLAAIEQAYLFTPGGTPVPLLEVCRLEDAFSYATIRRLDRKRAITLTAEVHR